MRTPGMAKASLTYKIAIDGNRPNSRTRLASIITTINSLRPYAAPVQPWASTAPPDERQHH